MRRAARFPLALAFAAALFGSVPSAQRFFREGSMPARMAPAQMPDAAFVICRLAYTRVRAEPSGIGWQTDYPFAEINLTTRLSELTKTRVSRDAAGTPNHYVVRPTDDTLFNCPMIVASDAGTIGFDDQEVVRLREYLVKGGFLWVDDFWGTEAWHHWQEQITQVLPFPEYAIEDVALNDPMLHSLFDVERVPQISNILFWRANGEYTSERGADSEEVHLRVIRDKDRRVMVVMTHNTDVADSWEREGEDRDYFLQFSPAGYALGIDVVLHVLTH